MARAPSTTDPFSALGEQRRREILEYLGPRERTVGEIALRLSLRQPSVSKHLRVLHKVGLVRPRRSGRCVLYRANGEAIRSLHDWTAQFERLWRHQLLRVKQRAEARNPQINSDSKEDV